MPKLQLLDEESGAIFTFNLTEENYARATTDVMYYTQLLENAKLKESTNTAKKEAADENEICNDGFRWVDQAIRLLLTAYMEREELLIKGKVSIKKFWDMISEILKEKSYNITGPHCKNKFHGLKKTYKKIKDHNAKSGNSRHTWPYFEIMDEMFGHKPWINPILTLDSANNIPSSDSFVCNSDDTTSLSAESSSSFASCSSERPRKRQKVNESILEELVTIAQENEEKRKKMYNETAERQERLLHILENMANKM